MKRSEVHGPDKAKIILQIVFVTVAVLIGFLFVRTFVTERNLERDLSIRANIVADRVAASVTPTIWNIFEKSVDRHYSAEVASAILDSELADPTVQGIVVDGNFGQVFMGKIRLSPNEVVPYSKDQHKSLLAAAHTHVDRPIKLGNMTIGTVRVYLTSEKFRVDANRDLVFSGIQIIVVSLVLVVGLYYVIDRTLIGPARSMAVAHQAFESLGSALLVTDAEGRLVDANTAYQALAGGEAPQVGEIPNLPFKSLKDAEHLEAVWRSKGGEESWEGEVEFLDQRNKAIPVFLKVARVHGGREVEGHRVTLLWDMTREKESEAHLQHLVEEASRLGQLAEQANQAKSEFLATMSHELRTPLNAIIGFSELLLIMKEQVTDEKREDYNRSVLSSGKHLLSVINDILDLSKVDAGKMELSNEEVELEPLLEECLRFLEPNSREREVVLKSDIEPDSVITDQRLFKQIIINILSNAVKFSERSSIVEFTGRKLKRQGYEVRIRDHGVGMTAQEVKKAMEPFVQLESSYSRTVEGTGLGLPLVARFTDLLDIEFTIESQPGQGTEVRLLLPEKQMVHAA